MAGRNREDFDSGSQTWEDHPQTGSLYQAEANWTAASPEASKRISVADAGSLLKDITGKRVRVEENPELGSKHTGPIAYVSHRGKLLVNPSITGDTHKIGFITHEAPHLMNVVGHGPNMAAKHLEVVRRALGDTDYKALKDHYDRLKVNYAGS